MFWTDELDALLIGGAETGPWSVKAAAVTAASGEFCSAEQARARYKRILARAEENELRTAAGLRQVTESERHIERAIVRNLREDLKAASAEAAELKALVDFYRAGTTAPIVVPEWRLSTRSSSDHVATIMASLADWHLDEVVEPEQILGLNKYNRQIAMQRVQRWVEKVITLPREYINGVKIEGLVVGATGDLFTGEIHPELAQTNEDKVLASLLYWMEPIIAALELLGAEYPGVEVNCVPGNHTRITEKYNHKNRSKESLEQFFWSVVKARLHDRGKSPNVTINVSPSSNMNINVYGRNYVLDHGYEFKGGSGISGAFAPLSLGAHRKNLRQVVAGMPMHTMWIGHMHQIINIPGVVMGGCLKGYDEYAFDLNLKPDENGAGQAMWVAAPERAQVMFMPIYVEDREEEGW